MSRNLNKLPGSWSLFTMALSSYKSNWKKYVGIIAIVDIPAAIYSILMGMGGDGGVNVVITILTVIMNSTLVWMIVQLESGTNEDRPKIGASYYAASSILVSFSLILLAIVVMLIPAMFGVMLFGTTLMQSNALGIGWQEQAISGFVALVLSAPSMYLMVRYIFAFVISAQDNFRPMRSLKASRFVTLGYFWPVLGRLVLLVLLLAVCSVPVSLVTFLVAQLHLVALTLNVFKLLASFVALPIFFLYIYKLYQNLEARALARRAASEAELESEAGKAAAAVA